jgi:hypothetical protein
MSPSPGSPSKSRAISVIKSTDAKSPPVPARQNEKSLPIIMSTFYGSTRFSASCIVFSMKSVPAAQFKERCLSLVGPGRPRRHYHHQAWKAGCQARSNSYRHRKVDRKLQGQDQNKGKDFIDRHQVGCSILIRAPGFLTIRSSIAERFKETPTRTPLPLL